METGGPLRGGLPGGLQLCAAGCLAWPGGEGAGRGFCPEKVLEQGRSSAAEPQGRLPKPDPVGSGTAR